VSAALISVQIKVEITQLAALEWRCVSLCFVNSAASDYL